MTPTLYHFTCDDHGYPAIVADTLRPNPHPLMPVLGPMLWLTDLADPPTPESVGLTGEWLSCNRLARRFEVHTKAAVPWSEIRSKADRGVVDDLERYGAPEHWWIVRRPLTRSEWKECPLAAHA